MWWSPLYIDGNNTKANLIDKDVRALDAFCCELKNVNRNIFAKKEEDYVIILMSTYVTNYQVEKYK